MKKLYSLLFAILLVLGALAGCGNSEQPADQKEPTQEQTGKAAFPVTIKDAAGKEVTIEKKPEKIVSLMPSNTEIAFALGLGDKIVGVSDFDNYPKEAAKKEKIGGEEINIEKIISLEPDLMLAHGSTAHNSGQGLKQLTDAGITVLVVNDATKFDDVYESITMIGKAAGKEAKAEEIIKNMKGKVETIKEKAKTIGEADRKKVFVEVSPEPDIYTPGKNTFMDEMLAMINAENVAGDLEGWAKIDQEAIIEKNPDAIVTTYGYYVDNPVDQVMNRNGWKDVKAVKEKQVIDLDADMVTRSGPRLAEGVEELAKIIYPEVFANK